MNKEQLKLERKLEKVQTGVLKTNIEKIVDLVGLDSERMSFRIRSAEGSEYGRVSGLTNLLAAIVCWPAEQGDGASVTANQRKIENELKTDIYLMEDIKDAKGYHTWLNDELELIKGKAPNTQRYQMLVEILVEETGINDAITSAFNEDEIAQLEEFGIDKLQVRHKLNDTDWNAREDRAITAANNELVSLKEASDEYEAEKTA